MEIRFTKAVRRHRIGRTFASYVMATATPTAISTAQGSAAWLYVGTDERGRELEIVAVEVPADQQRPPAVLVVHVMPTHLREES